MRFVELHIGEIELDAAPQGGNESGVTLIPGKPIKVYKLGEMLAVDGRKIHLEREDAEKLVADAHSRTTDIAILYEHGKDPTKGLAAAGWADPKSIELRDDGVWANVVRWTKTAYDEIAAKTRRFISGSAYARTTPEGVYIPERFREITLTNVPALVNDMEPVSASAGDGEGGTMDAKIREKLIGLYELPQDATDEAIAAALDEHEAAMKAIEKEGAPTGTSALDEKRVAELASAEAEKIVSAREAGAKKKAAEDFVASLVSAGKLTTDAEKAKALEMASADLDGFKVLAANFPVKSPVTKLTLGADGKPPKPSKADLIGLSAAADNLDQHRKVLDYMEASGEKNYVAAVLAVGRA